MQANDLDLAQMQADEAMTNVITFAKKDYASLPDDKYPVSDEELKAEWQKLKPMFKTDEDVRLIHYIAVNIDPSQEDIAAANKIADAAYIALQKGRGVDSVRLLGTVQIDTAKMEQKNIPAKVRDIFASAEVGTTRRDSTMGNHHVMYKLINKELSLDSVELSYVVAQGDAKFQKSIMDQLNCRQEPGRPQEGQCPEGGRQAQRVAARLQRSRLAQGQDRQCHSRSILQLHEW